jgi:predicted permease
LFGVAPAAGRNFTESEAKNGSHVLVIGAEEWHQLFHSDPHVVGRTIALSGVPYTVVGVMPESFRFQGGSDLLFSPLDVTTKQLLDRSGGVLNVLGRLRPGSTFADATRELNNIREQDRKTFPAENSDWIHVGSYAESLTSNVRPGLLLLNGLVLAVWLLATINVAGLLLTRTQGRRREIAVRAALGARSGRLMRQFLVESLLLSLAGGACGLGITAFALRLLRHYLSNAMINGDLVHVNAAVCVYVLATSCISALIFGTLPALQAARLPILSGLREGSAGSGSSRQQAVVRDGLVIVELALSLLLLVAAGVMGHTLYDLEHTALGFNPENVVTAELMFPHKGYWFVGDTSPNAPNLTQVFLNPLLERIQHLPGVSSAGVTSVRPLQTNWTFQFNSLGIAGRPKPDPEHAMTVNARAASSGYFRAMGIPLLQGRFFDERDSMGAPLAVVVNEAFAREVVGSGTSPVGLRLKDFSSDPWHQTPTIVGVMADARQSMSKRVEPEFILDMNQLSPQDEMYPILSARLDLVVRAHGRPDALIPSITRIVHDLNPEVGVNHPEPMATTVDDTMGNQTLAARLLTLFALAALVIAAAGLYGLLAYQVTQQMRDFGVRLALGAQRKDVLWLVLRRAIVLLSVGAGVGIAVSLALSRAVASRLAGVDLHNIVLVIEAVTVILAITCIVASYLPAHRAAQTDPMQALRHE